MIHLNSMDTSSGLLLGSLVAPGLATGAVVSVVIGSGFRDLATMVVLACTGAGLAADCLSAWLTTLLVYAGSLGYEDLFRGHPFRLLSSWVAAPSVWLFYLALPASLPALVRIRRPAALQQRWLMPAGASAGAAAAAVLVFVTGVSGLIEPPAPPSPVSSLCGRPGTVATSLPSLALDANQVLRLFLSVLGRPLTQAQGDYQIAAGVGRAAYYAPATASLSDRDRPTPTIEPIRPGRNP